MAITSELLGKLGGADVEVIPVSAPKGSDYTLCNLDLSPDKTYLVGASGVSSVGPSSTYAQRITIGDSITGYPRSNNTTSGWGAAGIISGPVEVVLRTNSSSPTFDADFEGMVYVMEVDL